MAVSSFHNTQERNGLPHGQQCIENHRVIDGLWANLFLLYGLYIIKCVQECEPQKVNVQH